MNECCFVWGAPLSGQRYWMARAADESAEDVSVVLMPLESQDPAPSLEEILARLSDALFVPPPAGIKERHIYCELPWSNVADASAIEDWIATRAEFAPDTPVSRAWNLSFVCLCPPDADRLPEPYRRALEEFSRASQSAVIVVRREGDDGEIEWLDSEELDFGEQLEIFEEDLWPAPVPGDISQTPHRFNTKEFEQVTLPVSGDRTSYSDLFQDLAHGYYGSIWGAELFWKNARGEQEALTLSQGRLFSWDSSHPSLLAATPLNGAVLNIAGTQLRRQDLMLALRSQSFC